MRRICRLDLLPYRSEIVLAVVAGPRSLPSPGEKQGGKGAGRTKGWRGREREGRTGGGRLYITAHEKRPSTKTFNFRSPSASSIQGVCESTGPGHESRHSAASHPFPILLAPPQTYGDGEKRRGNLPPRYHPPPRPIENFTEKRQRTRSQKRATIRRPGVSLSVDAMGLHLACTSTKLSCSIVRESNSRLDAF
ncbi:hypothetical protein K0M31_020293, partial [Melipona bicolor]